MEEVLDYEQVLKDSSLTINNYYFFKHKMIKGPLNLNKAVSTNKLNRVKRKYTKRNIG